jgi:signal transduction histidine kinase
MNDDRFGYWASRPRRGPSRTARLWFPVLFSLFIQVPSVFVEFGPTRKVTLLSLTGEQMWLSLALALLGPLALIAARRFPGPVVAIVTVGAGLDLFLGNAGDSPPYIALAFAIVSAVVRGARVWAWISVATGWVVSICIGLVLGVSPGLFRVTATTFGILIVFGIGEITRTRREAYAQLVRVRAQRQQSEVQAERVRIARELHDVLAHSLSQINVQAGVGLYLMDDQPDKAREALASIKDTSKSALEEVRSVLGVLRADGGTTSGAPLVPEPDLSRIVGLAATVSAQGVDVTVSGLPQNVPQATQLAMYRIVQESLTNIVRHAHATKAEVELGQSDGFYTITVTDDGTAPAPSADTEGRGLLGMRERAELLGGTLETSRKPGGGFRVAARIPIRKQVSAE